jgi:AraC-like DNA-binding protein
MSKLKIINKHVERYKNQKLTSPGKAWPFDVRDALICINNHLFDHNYSVKTMRDLCNLSDTNFSSRFRHYVGMTPREYITFHRVQSGMMLFRNKKLKHVRVSEIGFIVGYENPSSFTMTFKRYTGLSPKEWKRVQMQ